MPDPLRNVTNDKRLGFVKEHGKRKWRHSDLKVGGMKDIHYYHPLLINSEGTVRQATDNYGDTECPFCDVVILPEYQFGPIRSCWRCSARIIATPQA